MVEFTWEVRSTTVSLVSSLGVRAERRERTLAGVVSVEVGVESSAAVVDDAAAAGGESGLLVVVGWDASVAAAEAAAVVDETAADAKFPAGRLDVDQ